MPIEAVKRMVVDRCDLPNGYDVDTYEIFQGTPSRVLSDGESIDIGGRRFRVLHTPGHSPGHMCFWEEERGYLFTGDLVYKGELLAYYSLDIKPEIITRMRNAFERIDRDGDLRFGAGTFDYGDWSIRL